MALRIFYHFQKVENQARAMVQFPLRKINKIYGIFCLQLRLELVNLLRNSGEKEVVR
jgi:hypothetical protein